jgi:hypothetical protein
VFSHFQKMVSANLKDAVLWSCFFLVYVVSHLPIYSVNYWLWQNKAKLETLLMEELTYS